MEGLEADAIGGIRGHEDNSHLQEEPTINASFLTGRKGK
jgi:hypothetical protein